MVCPGRQGLSRENVQALSRHAKRAGLTRSKDDGCASLVAKPVAPADRILTFDKCLKHSGSCLPDSLFRVTVDPDRFLVTITSNAFDSHMLGWLVTQILPDEYGIKAYREDDSGWTPPPAPYDLRIQIGDKAGIELEAQVVRLSTAIGGGVAVRLSEPRQLMAGAH